jgi:hypothetical protein
LTDAWRCFIPFQLIGLALIVAVPHQVLALANPRPTITMSAAGVPVGGSLTFEWQLSGSTSRVSVLRLTLEGREEARYRRGTDTHVDTNVFHTARIVETTDAMGTRAARPRFALPPTRCIPSSLRTTRSCGRSNSRARSIAA